MKAYTFKEWWFETRFDRKIYANLPGKEHLKKKVKKHKSRYIRVKAVSFFNIIPDLFKSINGRSFKIGKYTVNGRSQRLRVFLKSNRCCNCGIEGTIIAVEKHKTIKNNKFHLNLYAVDNHGDEVLMTKDHIIPVSKNGKNTMENYQTMCCKCNSRKNNIIIGG